MAQTELVRETAKWRGPKAKGLEKGSDFTRSLETGFFLNFWIILDFLMQNYWQEKHLCKVV